MDPSAPEVPGVAVGAGTELPFRVCPGLGMLHSGTAAIHASTMSSVIAASEEEMETARLTCK